jgi:hypothetical protein
MGRPLNAQKYFGTVGVNGPNVVHQIQSTTWGANDSSALPGYLTKQNSTNRFGAHTINGTSMTTLSNGIPTSSGYSAVKVFPVGTDPIVYAQATANLKAINATVVNGGNNYHVNDVLNFVGGTFGNTATVTVNSVFANNAINAFTLNAVANQGYQVLPSNIAGIATTDTTNANGVGAIFSANFGLESVNVVSGGNNYTSAKFVFPGATTAPTVTSYIVAGSVVNNVVVNTAGIIDVNPTVVVEGTANTVEYVKNIQSQDKLLTWGGNVYTWLAKGVTPPADYANLSIKICYLDTL